MSSVIEFTRERGLPLVGRGVPAEPGDQRLTRRVRPTPESLIIQYTYPLSL